MRRLRLAVLCALAAWLLPGAAIATCRRGLYLPDGERRRRTAPDWLARPVVLAFLRLAAYGRRW